MSLPANPPWLTSRQWAPVMVVLALADVCGIFFAYSVSGVVLFFSNFIVLFGIAHSTYCMLVAAWMWFGKWSWRAEQMGFFAMGAFSPAYFFLSGYFGLVFYSEAPAATRYLMLALLVGVYSWWTGRVIVRYKRALSDSNLRAFVYVECENYISYLQQGDRLMREQYLKLRLEPSLSAVVATIFLGIVAVYFRRELVEYFGVDFIPIIMALLGFTLGVMFIALAAMAAILFFIYPTILRYSTGKPVYIDLLSKPSTSMSSN